MTHDRFVFGVTVDQIDRFNSLLRTITANGDMVAVSSAEAVHAQSVPTLGEAIFNAALAMREILDQVGGQRLSPKKCGYAVEIRQPHASGSEPRA